MVAELNCNNLIVKGFGCQHPQPYITNVIRADHKTHGRKTDVDTCKDSLFMFFQKDISYMLHALSSTLNENLYSS